MRNLFHISTQNNSISLFFFNYLQVVSSEPSEGDDLSSLANSDLESCLDAASPRTSLHQDSDASVQLRQHDGVIDGKHQRISMRSSSRSSQYGNLRNSKTYDINNGQVSAESNRNSCVYPAQCLSNEESSAQPIIPSSTTCPELYHNKDAKSTQFNRQTSRNRSDQDIFNNHPSKIDVAPNDDAFKNIDRRESNRSLSGEGADGDLSERGELDGSAVGEICGNGEVTDEDPNKLKAYRIVCELVNTEDTYVQILHLIDQVNNTRY